jgi:outer membrane PBP1 activator LpoA protein
MLRRLTRVLVLGFSLSGLCAPIGANTTAADPVPGAQASSSLNADAAPIRLAQSDITIHPSVPPPPVEAMPGADAVRVALLLPLRSETLGAAADALRAGFMAAYERDRDGIAVELVETGDAAPDIQAMYEDASTRHDIVVGPLSRTGVTAVAQSGAVRKPTIALTTPDSSDADARLPAQLLVVGLSIEDEARQVAQWADASKRPGKVLVISTGTAWQQRAANAFANHWTGQGKEIEWVQFSAFGGYLQASDLAQLKSRFEFEKPALIFAALDDRQARQVRAAAGNTIPFYGTSQLNPLALSDWITAERVPEMDGIRLVDIPWQLQADHPAAMTYPRLVVAPDQKGSADIERLYALGIDAYRVAREIAFQRTAFEIDGVTGKLRINLDGGLHRFERVEQQAVYRNGMVTALTHAGASGR